MAFEKITEEELNKVGVTTLEDRPAMEPDAMKAKFEETAKNLLAPKINKLIEALTDVTAAAEIGAEVPEKLPEATEKNIQAVLQAILGEVLNHEKKRDNPHEVTANQVGAYTKSETNSTIDKKIVEIGAGDMAQAVYDPQKKKTDIFKAIEDARQEGVFLYKVTFKSDRWGSRSPYTQTATVTPVNGGPNVTANSQICSGFGVRDDFGTDAAYHLQRMIAAELNRSKAKKFGSGTLTMTTNNKPLADVEMYFLAKGQEEASFGLTFPGGGSEIVMLWENRTTGLWSGRKVSLDLTAYDAVLIVSKLNSAYTQANTQICLKGFVSNIIVPDYNSNTLNSMRKAGIQSDGVQFGEAYNYGTNTINNNYNWPYRIYGVKF